MVTSVVEMNRFYSSVIRSVVDVVFPKSIFYYLHWLHASTKLARVVGSADLAVECLFSTFVVI